MTPQISVCWYLNIGIGKLVFRGFFWAIRVFYWQSSPSGVNSHFLVIPFVTWSPLSGKNWCHCMGGTQQQSPQQQAPNIPTQSWYPPSVLSPSTSSSRPGTPNNLPSAGQSPRSRPPAVGNNNVDSRPQSPSYSQPSPAAGASIIPLLRDKSVDELRKILSDKKAYNEVFHSIDQVRDQDALHDELQRETTQLAKKNLEKESQIVELRNQSTIIRTTELAAVQEKFRELEKRVQESVSFCAPGVLLERLRDAANAADEESENLHQQLLAGEIELSDFTQKYKKLRTSYHRQTLLHLAAKASLSPG